MNTYKKTLITFIIAFSFNFVNSQAKHNTLNNVEDFLFKEQNNIEKLFNKKASKLNNFTSPVLSKSNEDNIISKTLLIEETTIVSRKKSTLFELTRINGAGFSNTLYLMTIAIYRV